MQLQLKSLKILKYIFKWFLKYCNTLTKLLMKTVKSERYFKTLVVVNL